MYKFSSSSFSGTLPFFLKVYGFSANYTGNIILAYKYLFFQEVFSHLPSNV